MMMMMIINIIIIIVIIIIIYSHQDVYIKSISSSISCDDSKEQLKLPSLMNNSSSKSSTDVEKYAHQHSVRWMHLVISVTS